MRAVLLRYHQRNRLNPCEASNTTMSFLSSILQLLVDSGYVGAQELGILAQTSSEMQRATLQDCLWSTLCQRIWPNSVRFPTVEESGHRWLYKRWSAPIAKRKSPPLPSPLVPPSCTADQVQLFIDIKYNNVPVTTMKLTGEQLAPLLEEGLMHVDLPQPIIFGKAVWNLLPDEWDGLVCGEGKARNGLSVWSNAFDLTEDQLDVHIHVYRTTDSALSCVFKSIDEYIYTNYSGDLLVHPLAEEGEAITPQTPLDLSKDQEENLSISYSAWLDKDPGGLRLKNSRQARSILERVPHAIFFECFFPMKVNGEEFLTSTQMAIKASKQVVDSDFSFPFKSIEEQEYHGVTLLHILSELEGS